MKKTVVIGVTSGIAAYKSIELVKELKKANLDVRVVMTKSAALMVNPKDFEKASGKKVYTKLFEVDFNYKNILKVRKVDHIDLADIASVICVAPATANIIAKIASGIADDFLTTMLLASNSPVILAPSMNVHMWNNPVTKENIIKLKRLGFIVLKPERGMLACGYEGPGRLPHIQKIKTEIINQVNFSNSLVGKKVIVTAGGTTEPIDSVRVITNNSSGKMGIAIAEECHLRGAEVILLRAISSVEPRYVFKQEEFQSASDLLKLIKKHIANSDLVFHTAAVSDFKPIAAKIKLSSKNEVLLRLVPQKKIIKEIKRLNPKAKLIGFKATHYSGEKEQLKLGAEKLKETKADVIVVNDISKTDRGFNSENNEVLVVTQHNSLKISLRSKEKIAKELINHLII